MAQWRYPGSAMGIALVLSLAAHLPLLLWTNSTPPPPVLAGGRVHLQLSAAAAAETATAPAEAASAQPRSPSAKPSPAPPRPASAKTGLTVQTPARSPERRPSQASPVRSSSSASRVEPSLDQPAPPVAQDKVPPSSAPVVQQPAAPEPAVPPSSIPQDSAPPARDPSPAVASANVPVTEHNASPPPSSSGREQVQQALSRALLDHFRYPLKARRRHWEGEVVLRVTIRHDGRIGSARIDKSSGHRLLDQAALESLRQVPSLAGFTLERDMDLLLPVIYRLRG